MASAGGDTGSTPRAGAGGAGRDLSGAFGDAEAPPVHETALSGRPMWLTNAFVRRPGLCLLALVGTVAALTGAIAARGRFEISENTDYDFAVRSKFIVQQWLALEDAQRVVAAGDGDGVLQGERTVDDDDYRVQIMYRARETGSLGGLMTTRDGVAAIDRLERHLEATPGWENFCYAGSSTPACSPDARQSFAAQLDPPGAANLTEAQVDARVRAAAAAIEAGTPEGLVLGTFFGADFEVGHEESAWMRSFFRFGVPLDGFRNSQDRPIEQRVKYQDTVGRAMWDLVQTGPGSDDPDVEVLYAGAAALEYVFQKQVAADLGWSVGAILFVLFYMCVHTQSLFIGTCGIMQILAAFPVAFFVYRDLWQIALFQPLHIMSIFVICGIGADDIFVLYDAWQQAGAYPTLAGDLERRMAWTWRRASRAMLVTTATTAGAFTATAISTIIPVAAFGVWAATLVVCNYLLVITVLPCCIIIHHRTVRHWRLCPCLGRRQKGDGAGDGASEASEAVAVEVVEVKSKKGPGRRLAASTHTSSQSPLDEAAPAAAKADAAGGGGGNGGDDDDDDDAASTASSSTAESETGMQAMDVSELRAMERFFFRRWSPFVHRFRHTILVLYVALAAAAAYTAAQMEPLSEQEKWFPPGHVVARSVAAANDEFAKSASDNSVKVRVVWGIAGLDLAGVDAFDPSDIGSVVWDDAFDVSTPAAQLSVLRTCEELRASEIVFQGLLSCWMEDYRAWREEAGASFPAVFAATGSDEQRAAFSADVLRFAEEARLTSLVDYVGDHAIGADPDGRIRFITVEGVSTLRPFLPYATTFPVYERWRDFVDARNAAADTPAEAAGAYQTAGQNWSMMITEREFVSNALKGLALAMPMALLALLASTRNWIVSVFSIVTIASIVTAVLAVLVLTGSQFGVSESVATVIISGVSVDYITHVGHAYVTSSGRTRFERLRDALTEMGVSVVAGAVTTGGASSFLFGATILFFGTFARTMVGTAGFSLLFSLTAFSAALATFGPLGDQGVLRVPACCRRQQDDGGAAGDDEAEKRDDEETVAAAKPAPDCATSDSTATSDSS